MQGKKMDPLKHMRLQVKKLIFESYRTIEEFCWEKNLNKATVSNFLNAKKDFQISTLEKISKALNKNLIIKLN